MQLFFFAPPLCILNIWTNLSCCRLQRFKQLKKKLRQYLRLSSKFKYSRPSACKYKMAAYIKYLIIYIMILKISIIHGEPNVQSALRNRTRQTTESPSTIYKETPIPPYTPSISSEDRLDLPHTSGSLLVFLQRLNDRLTTMETLQHQQLRKLEGVDYK